MSGNLGWEGGEKRMLSLRDTDGTRAKGRRANCSREMLIILKPGRCNIFGRKFTAQSGMRSILGNPGATSRDDAIFSSERYFRAKVYFKC